jgi:hypothetical protein
MCDAALTLYVAVKRRFVLPKMKLNSNAFYLHTLQGNGNFEHHKFHVLV